MMMMTSSTTLPEESSQPDVLGMDLYSLEIALARLVDCPLISASLVHEIRSLYRSIKGCKRCNHMLGELHSGSCPTGGGRVLTIDLDYTSEIQPNLAKPIAVQPL